MSKDIIDKLYKEVNTLKESLRKMRFESNLGQLNNVALLKNKKKEIARKLTSISLLEKK